MRWLIAFLLAVCAASAQAQTIQTPDEAVAADAALYAKQYDVPLDQAIARLKAQRDSLPVTDALEEQYRDRLAGVSIEHRPGFRIVLYLTGDQTVPDQQLALDGLSVPVVFRTGAKATRDRVIWALTYHQAAIRALFRSPPGMGLDPRTGELVVTTGTRPAAEVIELHDKIAELTGVPVRLRSVDETTTNLAQEGGGRVEGINPADGKRYYCTTAFNVTDGTRTAVSTAAHCEDELSYLDPQRHPTPLTFVGQWGWGYQDVQINAAPGFDSPNFFADTARTAERAVTGQVSRASTRAGEFVCHRGEHTGYSCAEVELTDFAPAGDLCGGPCLPTWVTVAGPDCAGGDSGSPVFSGGLAYGILKGATRGASGTCAFYFYMSVDYLPSGWRLITAPLQQSLIVTKPQSRSRETVAAHP